MKLEPRLIETTMPDRPEGVVIVLHGGAARRENMTVSPTQLSVLRMIPIARRIGREGKGRLAVLRLLNARRGWDAHHTPVQDVAWALDETTRRLGASCPACLVGHSLGGRAALLAAGDPRVRSVVALAPWVYPTDVPRGLDDERILIVHGTHDRIASPQRAEALADRLRQHADVTFLSVPGGKHAMLSHHADYTDPCARFAVDTLIGGLVPGQFGKDT